MLANCIFHVKAVVFFLVLPSSFFGRLHDTIESIQRCTGSSLSTRPSPFYPEVSQGQASSDIYGRATLQIHAGGDRTGWPVFFALYKSSRVKSYRPVGTSVSYKIFHWIGAYCN